MPLLLGPASAPVLSRCFARAVDSLVALAAFLLFARMWTPLGLLVGALVVLLPEGMSGGHSIGKRLARLRVVDGRTGLPVTAGAAAMRNAPFAFLLLLASLPGSAFFLALLGAPVIGLELYLLFALQTGARCGDVLALTRVIEAPETDAGVDYPM